MFQKLIHDLRETLQTHYTQLLEALLINLPRSPQADALTVLLSTLSLFFKHLLGSTAKETLQGSWDILRTIVPKCNPEVQRAFAEVWATVLRRCKGDTRMAAVNLILQDLATIPDFGAWAFVHAFKVQCGFCLSDIFILDIVNTPSRLFIHFIPVLPFCSSDC